MYPKPCFGHTYKVSAWNSHRKCDFWCCVFSRDYFGELGKVSETTPRRILLGPVSSFPIVVIVFHDDVIKCKHFPRHWPFVRGIHRWPVDSPQKDQWRGALVFSFICAWTNIWANNRDAGDLGPIAPIMTSLQSLGCMSDVAVLSYSVTCYLYITGTLELCFHYWCPAYGVGKWRGHYGMWVVFVCLHISLLESV